MTASHPCSVLIVEDERRFRNVLRTSLNAGGFSVEEARNGELALLDVNLPRPDGVEAPLNAGEFRVVEAHSGEEALGLAQHQDFDLALLDVKLPGIGGVEACRRLKNLSPRTGIVAMVDVRDLKHDTVQVLEAGADDYVTKPFWLSELIARLRVVLCKARALDTHETSLLRAGSLTMDPQRRILWRSGSKVHLSPKEFDLLTFMMANQGAPLTPKLLLRSVWGPSYGTEVEYLRSYVRSLRKKVEADPANPGYILTAPWVGYRFRNPSDQGS
jgi:two-component system KDP operon response regulator KdpE